MQTSPASAPNLQPPAWVQLTSVRKGDAEQMLVRTAAISVIRPGPGLGCTLYWEDGTSMPVAANFDALGAVLGAVSVRASA